MNGNREKASLCISCHSFRVHVYEHAQGLMNRISVVSNKSQVYLKQILDDFKIKLLKEKAEPLQYLSFKLGFVASNLSTEILVNLCMCVNVK